jgi:hypothetical protein
VEREVIIVRDGAILWRGLVVGADKNGTAPAQRYLNEAWRLALEDGALTDQDAGQAQFRFSAP